MPCLSAPTTTTTLGRVVNLPPLLHRILTETPALKRAYLVGGCVRDGLLGRAVKDFDIEVFGLGYPELVRALEPWGRVDLVGKSFGVVKLSGPDKSQFDFSIARRDSKTAPGHKGFSVELDPGLSPEEAAARRDFTINALMFDPRSGETLDFFGGKADLEKGVLRHTSDAFTEDPLRVLRGMQFAARFQLVAAPGTLELCRSIRHTHAELAVERVRDEWLKWATRSTKPSLGLRFLADSGWLENYPELAAMVETPQDPEWHPEGNVFVHTGHCLDALVTLPAWQEADDTGRAIYSLAVLLHDVGKPLTTARAERHGQERIVSPGHESAGLPPAEAFFDRLGLPNILRHHVPPLIRNHMSCHCAWTDHAVRRLSKRLEPGNINGLCVVMTADHMGRPPKPAVVPAGVTELLERAAVLRVRAEAPKPILLGRHLLERGLPSGPAFGELLKTAYEAQLEGKFDDLEGALRWLSTTAAAPGG
jgi:tRNA nucleotidyltransferase (CCA-adding enzyme)